MFRWPAKWKYSALVRAKLVGIGAVLAAVVGLTVPAVAGASPPAAKYPESIASTFKLHGSHGYTIEVVSIGGEPLDITAQKRIGTGVLLAQYTPRQKQGAGTGVHVNLGRLGRIDVHFVEHQRQEVPAPPHCKGSSATLERGVFVGSIHFHGEHGYTRVDAGRAKGVVSREGPQTCTGSPGGPGEFFGSGATTAARSSDAGTTPAEKTLDLVLATADGTSRRFEALRFEGNGHEEGLAQSLGVSYFASTIGQVGSVVTAKSASVVGAPRDSFISPDPAHPLSAATVEPPAPFSGSATFALTSPKTAELTGNLAVELPGEGVVPLTSGIDAGLCEDGRCTKTLPAILAPAESGGEFTGEFFGE
jgi:hypothetical protein